MRYATKGGGRCDEQVLVDASRHLRARSRRRRDRQLCPARSRRTVADVACEHARVLALRRGSTRSLCHVRARSFSIGQLLRSVRTGQRRQPSRSARPCTAMSSNVRPRCIGRSARDVRASRRRRVHSPLRRFRNGQTRSVTAHRQIRIRRSTFVTASLRSADDGLATFWSSREQVSARSRPSTGSSWTLRFDDEPSPREHEQTGSRA